MEQLKRYEINIYYSSYCTYYVDAKNEEDAIIQSRRLPMNNNQLLTNIDNWKDADTATEIKNEEIKK